MNDHQDAVVNANTLNNYLTSTVSDENSKFIFVMLFRVNSRDGGQGTWYPQFLSPKDFFFNVKSISGKIVLLFIGNL